jgi:hypothetical protein
VARVMIIQIVSDNPLPRLTIEDVINGCGQDAVAPAEVFGGYNALQCTYLTHVLFGENGPSGLFSPVARAVTDFISLIFGVRCPPKMLRVHAAELPSATGMRGFMFRRRRQAMCHFAHYPGCNSLASLMPDGAVAGGLLNFKRPCEAVLAFVASMFGNPTSRGIDFSASGDRIAVKPQSSVVLPAVSTGPMFVAAIGHAAYTFSLSHLDLYKGWAWLEPALSAPTLGGFAICTPNLAWGEQS